MIPIIAPQVGYKSTDGGTTWNYIGPPGALISFIAIDPQHPSTIYAGTTHGGSGDPKDFSPGGIYKSTDGGATWSHIGPGGSNNIYPNVFSIAIDPYQTNILYASTAAGLYKSTDGGSSWSNIRKVVYDAIAINPQQSNILYAGTRNIGIEMSTDGGSSWDNIGPVIPKVFSTVVNPQQTNTIYAATPGGVYEESINRGNRWSNIGPYVGDVVVSTYIIAIDPKQTNTIYVAAYRNLSSTEACGIFKSIDDGVSWEKISRRGCDIGYIHYFIVIDPQTNTRYFGSNWGISKCSEADNSCRQISPFPFNPQGGTAANSLAIDPQDPETLYAGTRANGIYKSTDGGNSWTAFNNGLQADVTIYSLAIDPQQTEIIYAGTNFGLYSIAFKNDPIAEAGPDQVVATGNNVTLDGSDSSDPDGDSLTYSWTLLSRLEGSNVDLSNSASPSISFIPDRDGLYKFKLIVSDGKVQSSPDYVSVRALGEENKIIIATNKAQYKPSDTLELYVWAGNSSSAAEIKADLFIGFGFPDSTLYFLDPALNLKPANPTDPGSFTPFAQVAILTPGFVFPSSAEMNADSDGNGKMDSFRIFSVTLPPDLPPGEYFTFAALAEPGSAQAGSPQLLSPTSLAYFQFNP